MTDTQAVRMVPVTEEMRYAFYEATTVTREGSILNFDAGLRAALAALKSTAAKEGGAK